jgi:predicted nicotinamide N-methyase
MALTCRISLKGSELPGPEDFLSTSLGVIFPDDVTNQHGDAEHSLVYASPHLPKPLHIELAEPVGESDRALFSHHLWNSSLLLAELIEKDTLGLGLGAGDASDSPAATTKTGVSFDIRGKSIVELGAGTALPSIMAGLLGARRVVVTDYPAPAVMATLRQNVARNIQPELSPAGSQTTPGSSVLVHGHSWGQLSASDPLCEANAHAFDRVFVADCLWMPWQHENLHRSIDHFLGRTPDARCWVVAGFHTGREKMKGFFADEALARVGLGVAGIWERDCNGQEREWSWDREEDLTVRKRWLVVCELQRKVGGGGGGGGS